MSTSRAVASARLIWGFLCLVWATLTGPRAEDVSDEDEARERIKAWTESRK